MNRSNFEADFKNLTQVEILQKCKDLKTQKLELEIFLSQSSQQSLFANISSSDFLLISKILQNEDYPTEVQSSCEITLKQNMLKAIYKADIQNLISFQGGLQRLKEKLSKLKIIYENYRLLETKPQEEILSIIFLIKSQLKGFEAEDLHKKLFKHLNKKIEKHYKAILDFYKDKILKKYYNISPNCLKIEIESLDQLTKGLPSDFTDFRKIFLQEIQEKVLERMKIEINPEYLEITKINTLKNPKQMFFTIFQIDFETYHTELPQDDTNIEGFSLIIENFFDICFTNIDLFENFKENDDDNHIKDLFEKSFFEFMKILNIKLFEKNNRIKLSQKIKELEILYKSFDYFKKEFHSYFENIHYDEISERNRLNLLDFKLFLCQSLTKIKQNTNDKELYLILNERVKGQIELLEKQYGFLEVDIYKEEENKRIFYSFLYYFQLILEVLNIFDDEITEKNGLFYHLVISVLNITQKGIDKFSKFCYSSQNIRDPSVFQVIFNLNRDITRMETKFLNKLTLKTENSINN